MDNLLPTELYHALSVLSAAMAISGLTLIRTNAWHWHNTVTDEDRVNLPGLKSEASGSPSAFRPV